MIRRIYCEKCGERAKAHPDDTKEGWKYRKKKIAALVPPTHEVVLRTAETQEVFPLESLICDCCGFEIKDLSSAYAITMWRGKEPENWEKEYSLPLDN
jgi:hypothetical protein